MSSREIKPGRQATDATGIRPRNDRVLVRLIKHGKTGTGIYTPDSAAEGQSFHVVAVGPKVEDLRPGDKVMMFGQLKVDWDFLPGSPDLLVIGEKNVCIVYEPQDSYEGVAE